MSDTKFYALGLFAIKIKPASGQSINIYTNVGLHSWAVLAKSNEEARRKGIGIALEKWPEEDGWTRHDTSVAEISQGALSQALSIISGESNDDSEEIELIM